MSQVYRLRHTVYRSPANLLLLAATFLLVTACTTHSSTPLVEEPSTTLGAEFIPVTRYGRYTLVELSPTAAQQDLLLQIIDVSIPDTLNASVGDGLRHVLQRSGYKLCNGLETDSFNSLPLPATHYHLGPLMLRDALQTLVGPGWNLHIDQPSRQVCFSLFVTLPIIEPDLSSFDLDSFIDPAEETTP